MINFEPVKSNFVPEEFGFKDDNDGVYILVDIQNRKMTLDRLDNNHYFSLKSPGSGRYEEISIDRIFINDQEFARTLFKNLKMIK